MTGIFDNATTISIDDKEVIRIATDDYVLFEKVASAEGLYVTVSDGEDSPITDVTITFSDGTNDYTGTTDSSGVCNISNVPDGTYDVTAGEGYVVASVNESYTSTIQIDSSNNRFLIVLVPQTPASSDKD